MFSERESVELLHLHVVRLLAVGRQQGSLAIKGGCNLRFYFGSPRYSEDLDLDVLGGSSTGLKERMDGVLAGRPLREALAVAGIRIARTSVPKQTETTQRWKLQLEIDGRDVPVHTKIECSRRERRDDAVLEAVDARLVAHYRLMPLLACHYPLRAALTQKVGALIGRRTVQARDVFDLSVLFAQLGPSPSGLHEPRPRVEAALERVWQVDYDEYRGQVAAYLEPAHAESMGGPDAWEALQLSVATALEALRRAP
jgi:hypothetical protein